MFLLVFDRDCVACIVCSHTFCIHTCVHALFALLLAGRDGGIVVMDRALLCSLLCLPLRLTACLLYLRRIGRLERRLCHYREHRLAVHPAALHAVAHPVVLQPQRPQQQQPQPERASAVPAQSDPATHFHDTCAVDGLHSTGRSERGCVDGVEERVLGVWRVWRVWRVDLCVARWQCMQERCRFKCCLDVVVMAQRCVDNRSRSLICCTVAVESAVEHAGELEGYDCDVCMCMYKYLLSAERMFLRTRTKKNRSINKRGIVLRHVCKYIKRSETNNY